MTDQNLDAWQFTCRLNADRADYVRALSDRLEISAAETVRLALDYVCDRVPSSLFEELRELPPETRKELARLTQEVNRIGVNVNQAVRAINTRAVDEMFIREAEEDDVDRDEIEQMRAELEDLRIVLKREMQEVFLELVELGERVKNVCRS
ncbi:hypothetical protein [Corynebacterium sp. HMSC059E07]|uniref:hypothetical protein n=1 Tax=Corynebacterium sp. HMSC059E07 TaxID=1739471 RepID=UPI00130163A1|nr:hypothetical protein [Corynebacterium sp. HMSC059E07]